MSSAADLFSGAGGTTTGVTAAGLRVEWCANHNPAAIACHAANYPDALHVCQDLAELDWTSVPAVRHLFASPACQGFSQNGQPARKGTGGNGKVGANIARKQQSDRNTAWAVLAAADSLRPHTIAVENVEDFQRWPVFDAWCGVLRALGYVVRAHTLNGARFGGAQDRPRTIVTAGLGVAIDLPPSNGAQACTIGDCLDSDDNPENRWRDVATLPARMRALIAKAQRQAGTRCFWANVSQSRGRPLDDLFPTATTSSGTQWNLIDGARCRVLNPREIARSMSFPEDYKLPAHRKLCSRLLGNAMDVRLAQAVAEACAAA